MKLSKLKL